MIARTLERTKRLVWPEINRYLKSPQFPKEFQIPGIFRSQVDLFWKINREYPERKGKYLRPTLVLLVAEALGLNVRQAVKTAAAMQLSEDWILIHDDIQDKSIKRRGKPTLHRIYGEELAMNAGDALHMVMWKIITDIGSKEISEEFFRMLFRTSIGQGVEQIWTNKKKKLNEKEYYFVSDSKSAYYSIAGPMRLGAILSKASPEQIGTVTEFGLHLGRCFQLIDDLIDIKQDKKEGKYTLATSKGSDVTIKLAKKEKEIAQKIFESDLDFLSRNPARKELVELVNFILERRI